MADVTPILIKDLAAQTTLQDTDYFIVGGEDAKKITVGQMKEALGINELNTNITDGNKGIKVKDIYLGDNVYLYHDNGVFGVRVYIDRAYHFFHIRKDGLYFDGGKIT